MPYKKKKAKTYRKKNPRNKTLFSGYKVNLAKEISIPLPDQLIVNMKYCDNYILTPGATGFTGTYSYRANSIYAPCYTYGSHQAMGHDEMALLYSRYGVISSRITTTFAINSLSAGQSCIVGIHLDDDSSISANPQTVMEQSRTKKSVVAIGGAGLTTVTNRWSYKQSAGYLDPIHDANNAAMGGNPAQVWYYNLFGAAMDFTSSPSPIPIVTTIVYKCQLYK